MRSARGRGRGASAAAAALCCASLVAACGGDDGGDRSFPKGPPEARHGEAPVSRTLRAEEIRSRLAAASESYSAGRPDDALVHADAAGAAWTGIRKEVTDRVLVREVDAAFLATGRQIRRRATFDGVRDRLSPLATQLMDGVVQDLVPRDARNDPGVQAAVLVRLTESIDAGLERGRAAGGGASARLAYEHAFGLTFRAQAVARDIAATLGPDRAAVVDSLRHVRSGGFPEGVAAAPAAKPEEIRSETEEVREALERRYGLGSS